MSRSPDWEEVSLDAIGLHYGTDKASSYHDHLRFYEGFLSHWRQKDLKIIEIGVYDGQSLNVWERFFPNARIIGCDIKPLSKQYETDRVTIEIIDQANVQDLTQLSFKYGPFDLIIEDGSHMREHQTTSLRTLFPFLKVRGIYIIEDMQTNYGKMAPSYRFSASETCVEYLKGWLDLRVADGEIDIVQVEDALLRTYGWTVDSLTFYRWACLIQKGDGASSNIVRLQMPMMKRIADELKESAMLIAHVSTRGGIMGDRGFINPVADDKYYETQGDQHRDAVERPRIPGQARKWTMDRLGAGGDLSRQQRTIDVPQRDRRPRDRSMDWKTRGGRHRPVPERAVSRSRRWSRLSAAGLYPALRRSHHPRRASSRWVGVTPTSPCRARRIEGQGVQVPAVAGPALTMAARN